MDNVLLMQELVDSYHKDEDLPRCASKLHLIKAYNSVAWAFLFDVMEVFDFPRLFIHWVRQYVTGAKFLLKKNGALEGYFPGKKGL